LTESSEATGEAASARFLVAEHNLSKTRTCAAIRMSRSSWYRPPPLQERRDREVIEALNALVEKHPRWGFWKSYDRLRIFGQPWNHRRVYRVYKAMNLNLLRRTKRRLPKRVQQPMVVEARANAEWSMDFMSDTLYHGRRFRTLNVLDEGVREALDIVIDTSVPGGRVVRTLDRLIEWRGKPDAIRVDNRPEYLSHVSADLCRDNSVKLIYIQPGKPNQNAYIERFNRTYRHGVLNAYVFESLRQVGKITRAWITEYNEERPHNSLGKIPPAMFRRQVENARNSTSELSH
jgi:putative transposase